MASETKAYLGHGLKGSLAKKFKPRVTIGVDVSTTSMGPNEDRHDWRKEEHQRLTAECAALQKELDGFNPKEAAEKMRRGIEIKLKLKKLRLEECKLKMDSGPSAVSDY